MTEPSSERSDGYWGRYLSLCNRRGTDFWSVVFGYPLARALLAFLPSGRGEWLTPTKITLLGAVVKAVSFWALLQNSGGVVCAGAIGLQVAQVLDSMDGTLARARKTSSPLGAYLDKVLDGASLLAMSAVVGLRGYRETGEEWLLLLALLGGGAFLLGSYGLWVARAAGFQSNSSLSGGAPVLIKGEVFPEWCRGWLSVWRFQEADLYLWVGVLAALGRWQILCIGFAATQLPKTLAVITFYGLRISRGR